MNIYHDIRFSFSILLADISRFRSRRKTADAMRLPLQFIYIYFTLYIVICCKNKIYLSIYLSVVSQISNSVLSSTYLYNGTFDSRLLTYNKKTFRARQCTLWHPSIRLLDLAQLLPIITFWLIAYYPRHHKQYRPHISL